jgi:hypothetical protein
MLPNLTSMHSWLGIAAATVFFLNIIIGFFNFATKNMITNAPNIATTKSLTVKNLLYYFHRAIGQSSVFLTIVAIGSGIMNFQGQAGCFYTDIQGLTKPDYNPAAHYSQLPAGCKISNGIGVTVVCSSLCVIGALGLRYLGIVYTSARSVGSREEAAAAAGERGEREEHKEEGDDESEEGFIVQKDFLANFKKTRAAATATRQQAATSNQARTGGHDATDNIAAVPGFGGFSTGTAIPGLGLSPGEEESGEHLLGSVTEPLLPPQSAPLLPHSHSEGSDAEVASTHSPTNMFIFCFFLRATHTHHANIPCTHNATSLDTTVNFNFSFTCQYTLI